MNHLLFVLQKSAVRAAHCHGIVLPFKVAFIRYRLCVKICHGMVLPFKVAFVGYRLCVKIT